MKRIYTTKNWIREYKANSKCEICGESHPATLDFHHIDPAQKDIAISKIVRASWSIDKVKEEIVKCQVLCSNCHRKLHWKEKENGSPERGAILLTDEPAINP